MLTRGKRAAEKMADQDKYSKQQTTTREEIMDDEDVTIESKPYDHDQVSCCES